jgi:flagellar motor switch protein FliN
VSPAPIPEITTPDQEYSRVWAESAARILEQLHGAAFVAKAQPTDEPKEGNAPETDCLWINFKLSGRLAGDQAFQFSSSDGVRLAQMLMSEPLDADVPLSEGHTDALNELFRQFAGLVATACKTKYGAPVEFQLETALAPTWQAVSHAPWIFAAPQVTPLQWKLLVSTELHAALLAADGDRLEIATAVAARLVAAEAAAPPAAAVEGRAAPGAAASPASTSHMSVMNGDTSNLDLLLDVELDASLRFGQREMLLREILELRPGSVVELNRQLQEPAELLVGGRIIARGEVVIVDGNYGLRITDIVQPQKRLESVRT